MRVKDRIDKVDPPEPAPYHEENQDDGEGGDVCAGEDE